MSEGQKTSQEKLPRHFPMNKRGKSVSRKGVAKQSLDDKMVTKD